MTRAELDKRPGDVAAMFDDVAGRYDLLNDVLSLGQDRYWRRVVARIVGARPGERVLDLAAGTGTSSLTFTATGADCVACDFSLGHAPGGAGKARRPEPEAGDGPAGRCASWPATRCGSRSRDGAFDAVTISFGLRNVADPVAAPGRDAPRDQAGRAAGGMRVQRTCRSPRLDVIYGRYLLAALPGDRPAGWPGTRTPTSTWPSRSGLAGPGGAGPA